MWTVAFFAGTALALAVMGVYGVLAFVVRQRAREIGIRVALGATPSRILGAVMSRGVRLVILGTALGAVLSGLLTRSMASLVFGVSAYDPWTFLAVALVLMGVSLLACWLPGRRAASVDAIAALRES